MNTVEPIRDMDLVMDLADYLKSNNERDYVLFMFGIYTGLRRIIPACAGNTFTPTVNVSGE